MDLRFKRPFQLLLVWHSKQLCIQPQESKSELFFRSPSNEKTNCATVLRKRLSDWREPFTYPWKKHGNWGLAFCFGCEPQHLAPLLLDQGINMSLGSNQGVCVCAREIKIAKYSECFLRRKHILASRDFAITVLQRVLALEVIQHRWSASRKACNAKLHLRLKANSARECIPRH